MANALRIWCRKTVPCVPQCQVSRIFRSIPCRSDNHKQMSTSSSNSRGSHGDPSSKKSYKLTTNGFSERPNEEYLKAIRDLNYLQTNNQVIALAKYKNPKTILPLFAKQLKLAGIETSRLNSLNIVHISGTKGKGSTCALLESILRASGLKTGFYNSPHLVKVTERIKINGVPISEDLFSSYFRTIFDRLCVATKIEGEIMPSYFSFLTILAFHIFIEEKVDCAILEVGIGGEYDPTNIIENPIACGITTLDFDHTNILGNTLKSIAWSKAGIIKKGCEVFTLEHDQQEALDVIKTRASSKGCPVHICEPLDLKSHGIKLGINGLVQQINASLACYLARHFLLTVKPNSNVAQVLREAAFPGCLPQSFRRGLEECNWPGRCQIIQHPRIKLFLDGAHTRKSMENCVEWFHETSRSMKAKATKVLMLNIIGDRDKADVLRPSITYGDFDLIIFSTNRINSSGETPKSETFVNSNASNNEKSIENAKSNMTIWSNLYKETRGSELCRSQIELSPNVSDALELSIQLHKKVVSQDMHILVTGSLHFVGAMLETIPLFSERFEEL